MDELKDALSSNLGPDPWRVLTLRSETNIDRDGKLDGRVFTENPAFGSQSTVIRIHQGTQGSNHYDAEIHVEEIPGINLLSMFFPLTESRRAAKELARRTKELVTEYTGASVSVPIDKTIAANVSYLEVAEGILGVFFGAFWGFLLTGPGTWELLGGLIGGALGVVSILTLTLRTFD